LLQPVARKGSESRHAVQCRAMPGFASGTVASALARWTCAFRRNRPKQLPRGRHEVRSDTSWVRESPPAWTLMNLWTRRRARPSEPTWLVWVDEPDGV